MDSVLEAEGRVRGITIKLLEKIRVEPLPRCALRCRVSSLASSSRQRKRAKVVNLKKKSRDHRQVVAGLFYLFQREYFTTRNTTVSSQGFKALRKTVNDSVGRLHIDPDKRRTVWRNSVDDY
jgi:hypothetical protein